MPETGAVEVRLGDTEEGERGDGDAEFEGEEGDNCAGGAPFAGNRGKEAWYPHNVGVLELTSKDRGNWRSSEDDETERPSSPDGS